MGLHALKYVAACMFGRGPDRKVWIVRAVGILHCCVVFIAPHRKPTLAGPHSCLKNADCFLLSLAAGQEP